jgi:Zn finger protein HypA/HybF involved in hydrogenase expression
METGVMTCTKHETQAIKQDTQGKLYCPRCRSNAYKREINASLRELCGTSARAAREDMGL